MNSKLTFEPIVNCTWTVATCNGRPLQFAMGTIVNPLHFAMDLQWIYNGYRCKMQWICNGRRCNLQRSPLQFATGTVAFCNGYHCILQCLALQVTMAHRSNLQWHVFEML